MVTVTLRFQHGSIELSAFIRFKGAYPADMLDFETLDFAKLFKTDFERNLCCKYLCEYEKMAQDLNKSLFEEGTLLVKLNLDKHLRYLNEMINLFSKYYNKVHVLEVSAAAASSLVKFKLKLFSFQDPKFPHLHEQMNARVYLLKLILKVSESILDLFHVKEIKRI